MEYVPIPSYVLYTNVPPLQARPNWISSTNRPAVLGTWIKAGRNFDKQPDLANDVKTYALNWSAWWKAINPADNNGADRDWSSLAKGGPNGLYVVILSLGWWLFALHSTGPSADYLKAIEEVQWSLEQVRNSLGKKRLVENDLVGGGASKK